MHPTVVRTRYRSPSSESRALMPGARDTAEFWRNIVTGRDLITECRPAAGGRGLLRPRPLGAGHHLQPPRRLPARRRVRSPRPRLPPCTLAAIDTGAAARPDRRRRAAGRPRRNLAAPLDRERVSVILGVHAQPSVGTMDARIQRPLWLKALREQGIEEAQAQRGLRPDRRAVRAVAGGAFPGPARQRRGRPDREPPRPGRHQLRRRRRLRQLARGAVDGASTSWRSAGPTSSSPAAWTRSTTSSCTCASARRPRCRRPATARPFYADADGTMLGEGIGDGGAASGSPTPSGTATGSTR